MTWLTVQEVRSEPSVEQVEAGARARNPTGKPWEELTDASRREYRGEAREVLRAAAAVEDGSIFDG
jgi:hypothetical protein